MSVIQIRTIYKVVGKLKVIAFFSCQTYELNVELFNIK